MLPQDMHRKVEIATANIGKAFKEMTVEECCEGCGHLRCSRCYLYDNRKREIDMCTWECKDCYEDSDEETAE
jgi:hypothetical protein